MPKRPLILVTNDDGITAPGIRHLISVMETIGEVVVVAPDSPQSGMGHAITINNTLQIQRMPKSHSKHIEYSCSGTPADCVKMAMNEILDRKPDLCVSGINHGSNSSINVIYSGTMSAAIEAGIEGVPAIGFSHLNYGWDTNFNAYSDYILSIAKNVLKHGLPDGIVFNVNIPNVGKDDIKGVRVSRQARANWIEELDKRQTPQGEDYYWLTGKFVNYDKGEDTDVWALENNYISIVPTQFDLTAHHFIQKLNTWSFDE